MTKEQNLELKGSNHYNSTHFRYKHSWCHWPHQNTPLMQATCWWNGHLQLFWSQMICFLTIWFMLLIKSWLLNICMQISIKIDLHIRVWFLVLHLHWWYTVQRSFRDVYKYLPNNMCTCIINKIISPSCTQHLYCAGGKLHLCSKF